MASLFPQMAEVVQPGEKGAAKVEIFEVSHEESVFTSLRAIQHPHEYVPEGSYARLKVDGETVMTDTRMERRSNSEFCFHARGRVLVAGLGLGMILHHPLEDPAVTDLTVVEKSQDVIDLISPTLQSPKLNILNADIFTWRPTQGAQFDTIYFDIWPNISDESLDEIRKLHRAFRPFLAPDGWMESWMRKELLSRRRQDKRRAGLYF